MPTLAQNGSLPDRLVTRAMLREFTPASDMTLFRWIREGDFPRPLARARRADGKPSGPRHWLLSELQAWLAKRAADRDAAPSPEHATDDAAPLPDPRRSAVAKRQRATAPRR